jgi:hypothetical protein
MGRGLVILVSIFVVMGVFIWGAVQTHRNPNAQHSIGWLVFFVIAVLLFTHLAASLL